MLLTKAKFISIIYKTSTLVQLWIQTNTRLQKITIVQILPTQKLYTKLYQKHYLQMYGLLSQLINRIRDHSATSFPEKCHHYGLSYKA